MSLASDIAADIAGVFMTDFAVEVDAVTWGNSSLKGIFDSDYLDFEGTVSKVTPFLLIETTDMDADATTGDVFIIDGANYKLVDIQYYEPGISRIVLANA